MGWVSDGTMNRMRDDETVEVVAGWLAEAHAAWPEVSLDGEAFVARTIASLPEDVKVEHARALHAADLWLAAACAAGNAVALASFEEHYVVPLDPILARGGLTSDQFEAAKQELRRELLASNHEPPGILEYSGRADLRTWLRAAALRIAFDLRGRANTAPNHVAVLGELSTLVDDPDLARLRSRYRDELVEAIEQTLAQLPPRERLLLKYHFVDGRGFAQIAAIYGVDRATAARWVVAAREVLAGKAQDLLETRLGVTPSQVRSIARFVETELDVSVMRMLA
jgi:RNA polymerase sigma-70 factor (ECF subfamily)